jgi:hypothetical protein
MSGAFGTAFSDAFDIGDEFGGTLAATLDAVTCVAVGQAVAGYTGVTLAPVTCFAMGLGPSLIEQGGSIYGQFGNTVPATLQASKIALDKDEFAFFVDLLSFEEEEAAKAAEAARPPERKISPFMPGPMRARGRRRW